MYDFGILITLVITITIFYLSTFIQLRKSIKEYEIDAKNDPSAKSKIAENKKLLNLTNILFAVLLSLSIFLYVLPRIFDVSSLKTFTIADLKIFPFKDGFFDNHNFKFSYITGISLSVLIIFTLLVVLFDAPKSIFQTVLGVIYICGTFIGLTWANYYISNQLVYCIVHWFELFSLVSNIIVYIILFVVLYMIEYFLIGED